MRAVLMMPALAAAALVLEKPFTEPGWSFSGDAKPGTDVVRLGARPEATGAVWLDEKVPYAEWTLDATLRTFKGASGGAAQSGVAVWYVSEKLAPGPVHGSQDKWDGLAVMLDSLGWDDHGNNGDFAGAIRGHLNDGTVKLTSFSQAAEQAFALCRINYREIGASPLRLRMGYGRGAFIVTVNEQKCFATDKVVLPAGYFGVSGNTDASEDTFAVDRLAVAPGLDDELAKHFAAEKLQPRNKFNEEADAAKRAAGEIPAVPAAGAVGGAPAAHPPVDAAAVAASGVDASELNALKQELAQLQVRLGTVETGHVAAQGKLDKIDGLQDDHAREQAANVRRLVDDLISRQSALESRVTELVAAVGGLAASSKDKVVSDEIANIHNKISHITSAVDSHRESFDSRLNAPAPAGASLLMVVIVVVIAQVVFYLCYNVYQTRKNRHLKLL